MKKDGGGYHQAGAVRKISINNCIEGGFERRPIAKPGAAPDVLAVEDQIAPEVSPWGRRDATHRPQPLQGRPCRVMRWASSPWRTMRSTVATLTSHDHAYRCYHLLCPLPDSDSEKKNRFRDAIRGVEPWKLQTPWPASSVSRKM
jgi:hypothetical protein